MKDDLTSEQKFEKAVQCVISYAHYIAHQELSGAAETTDVLMAAAARTYKCMCIQDGHNTPEEWTGQAFAQYMRECVLDA